jgi:CubicO group peptidase (beta-lactamase class C family)
MEELAKILRLFRNFLDFNTTPHPMSRITWLLCFLASTLLVQSQSISYPSNDLSTTQLDKIRQLVPAINTLYRDYAERVHSPGLVWGIVANGQLIASGQNGFTDIKNKTIVTNQSVFRIASMSKSFTAMALLRLRDEGKISLEDPVVKYIPEFAKAGNATKDAPVITIRHLLAHLGGFPEDNPWGDRQLQDTDKELLDLISGGLNFSTSPGTQYEYSNLGITIAGHIISKVTGTSYQQYITENIFRPLGMNNTYWEYSKVPTSKLAHGYRWINEQWTEEELLHDGAYGAMGGLLTSLDDFVQYTLLHLSAWPPRDAADVGVVKRSTVREMHMPVVISSLNGNYKYPDGRSCAMVTGYGNGLRWSRDCEGRITIGHSGGLPGFGSNWSIAPHLGIGVICFSNVTYSPTAGINNRVLDTLIRTAGLKPAIMQPSAILLKRQQQLVKIIPEWKEAESSGIFAENFFPDYPIGDLKKQSAQLFAQAGKVLKVHDIIPENNLRGTFRLECERSDLYVYFTLTPERDPKIQEYRIREIKR